MKEQTMNIKPTPEQVDDWELEAAKYAESQTSEYYEYQQAKNEKFAELAAQWGAAQAQQTTEPEAWNQAQVCTWIGNQLMTHPSMFERSEVCKFVRGLGRNAVLRSMFPKPQAQQTKVEGPELPEAAKCEGGWGELCVYYYTAAQMHEHYAAGVRAGAAGSQDANEEVVTITVPLSHINSLQVESIKRLVARTKHAHMTDVRIRINGNYEYFEADWLKYVVIGGGA